ncbi:SpvB/TcaC N-terminal domain-containing protein [Nocardia sp. SC052]|uniref:SpvB/TcaC N-terminal domain-containing protein n=1 Tax=Nocardia sichangensis TaxID=3385975 RepID=UPI00399FDC99
MNGDQQVSLPKGGGAVGGLGGSFSPDLNTGGGGYEIPFDLPEGRNGHTPAVALRYGTGMPNGPFGLGWGIGLIRLDRDTSGGAPEYAAGDPLVAPGVGPLRPGATDPNRFLPETDGLVWDVRRVDDGFEILQRDGIRHTLGSTAESRVSDPADAARVASWLVHRSVTADGEAIEYRYIADGAGRLLAEIRWAVYRLVFHYENRGDQSHDGRFGFLVTTSKRCSHVDLEVTTEAQPVVRRWSFTYDASPTSGQSLLASVTTHGVDAAGADLALPTARFEYTSGYDADLHALPGHVATALASGAVFTDLSGDGLPDVVQLGGGRIAVCRNRGGLEFDRMVALDGRGVPNFGVGDMFAADTTGRGRVDLLSSGDGLAYRYPIEGDGQVGRPIVTRDRPALVPGTPDVRVADVDGDRAVDLVSVRSRVLTVDRQADDGWETTRRALGGDDPLAGVDTLDEHLSFASMSGDGRTDLVSVRSGRVRWWPALGGGRWAAPRDMDASPVLPTGYRTDRLFLVDVDGDGCDDLVYVDRDVVRVWYNRNGNSFGPERVIANVPGLTATRVEFADLDGRGVAGLVLLGERRGRPAAWFLSFQRGGGPLLASVDGGIGDRLEITYESSVDHAARDRRSGARWSMFLPIAIPVVARVVRWRFDGDNPHETLMRYHDGAWDAALQRFLGFGRVESFEVGDDSAAGILTQSEFHVGRPPDRVGHAPSEDERLGAQVLRGRLIRSSVRAWDGVSADLDGDAAPVVGGPLLVVEQDWAAHLFDVDGCRSARPRQRERRELHFDGAPEPWRTTTSTNVAWDDWENVTESVQRDERSADPADVQEVRSTSVFAVPNGTGVRDRPARVVQTAPDGSLYNLRILRYDGTGEGLPEGEVGDGHLTSEERLALTDQMVTDVYGSAPPDFAALGYHRRPDAAGWFIWSARYERADMAGPTPTMTTRDPRGAAQVVEFDADRLGPTRVIDARGNVTAGVRDARACKVGSVTDANGSTWRNEYDTLGRLVTEFRPGDPADDPSVRLVPNADAAVPFSERTASHISGGTSDVVQRELFDADGHLLVRGTRGGDGTWIVNEAAQYNWRGLAAIQFTPHRTPGADLGPVAADHGGESYRYDALGRLMRQEHPDGTARTAAHEPGRSVMHDEEDLVVGGAHEGTPTVFDLDCAGRVRRVQSIAEADGTVTTEYRYSIRNKPVTIVDPAGRTTAIAYDLEGRQISVDDPDAGMTTFVYDASGNLTERRNGLAQRVISTYDELNRLRLVSSPDTGEPEVQYVYVDQADAMGGVDVSRRAGRLVELRDTLGVTTLGYDARGELTSKHVALPSGEAFDIVRVIDRLGRLARVTYPRFGAVAAKDVDYTYDEFGRIASISGVVDAVVYDARGDATEITHANGVVTRVDHDTRGRTVASTVTDGSGTLLESWTLDLDGTGNVRSVTDHFDATRTWTYEFDHLYQLTAANRADGTARTYQYDVAGNIVFGSDVGAVLYGENGHPAGCATTVGADTLDYDAIGRQTGGPEGTIAYDPMNRMTSITSGSKTVEQRFGAFGRPTIRTETNAVGTLTTICLDDLVEIRGGRMICSVSDGEHRIAQFTAGQPVEHLHSDHRNSTTLITGKDGKIRQRLAYDPFGAVLAEQAAVDHVDSGRRADGYRTLDGFGLQFVDGRLYQPGLGRFTTVDPTVSDLWHPIALNRYVYVANNPVTHSDPSGRAWWHVVVAIVAVVAVVALTIVTFGAGLIGLGGMIGVFAAMAAGGAVGGIAAAQAGGGVEEILLGIFVGAALAGAAALGGAMIGFGLGLGTGVKVSFLAHLLSGAATGLLLGAATGFAAGFAGGMGSAGDIWKKTWQSALIGMAIGVGTGIAGYLFQQGALGTGRLAVHGAKEPIEKAGQRALSEGAAKGLAAAGKAGSLGGAELATGATQAVRSFASNFYTYGGTSGFPVLEVLVFNPVAQNLLIMGGTSVFSLDAVDEVSRWLRENDVNVGVKGEF